MDNRLMKPAKLDSRSRDPQSSKSLSRPVQEGDGFIAVSHSRHTKAEKHGPNGSPPSAAAISRAAAYQHPPGDRGGNYMKQSCLPVRERDPELVELEKNRGSCHDRGFFKPGTIIHVPLHEQDYNATSRDSEITRADDKYRTPSRFGTIYSNYRKMIVVANYADHYISVPLFSHNGLGLVHKRRPDKYVSVLDHRSKGDFQPQSKHAVLKTEYFSEGVDVLHPKTTAHTTYPHPRRYDLPVVLEGRLSNEGIVRLINLVNKYAPNSNKV